MKRGIKKSWKTEGRLLFLVWGVLVLLGAMASGLQSANRDALYLEHAELLSVPQIGFTPPPAHISAADFSPNVWVPVSLPYVIARELVPPAKQVKIPTSESLRATVPAAKAVTGDLTTVDWYRVDLIDAAVANGPLFLYLPRWKTIGQIAIYGDGKLLYQSTGSVLHNGFNHPLWLPLALVSGPSPSMVMLRVNRLVSSGSALSTLWVGSQSALVWRYQVRRFLQNQLPSMTGAAFLAVGLFALAVWMQRRNDLLYLLFFAISVLVFVRMLHYHIEGDYLLLPDDWFEWLTTVSLMWLVFFLFCFLEYLHAKPALWLIALLLGIMLVCSAITAPGALAFIPDTMLIAPLMYALLVPFFLLISITALYSALRTRSREIWIMAGSFFVGVCTGTYDVALQNNLVDPEGMYVNPLAITGMLFMFISIFFGRYKGALSDVERVNASLAMRLAVRESELELSHQRLREVEQKQILSHERQRMMQDMHDGLGSSLVSAIRSMEGGGMTDTAVTQLLKDCMDDLKLAIDSMVPVESDLLLLLATLRFRLEPRLDAAGIVLLWKVEEVPALHWLDPSNALHILRIVQECIANVLRHTHATQIKVSTLVRGSGVQVLIEDNGQGFDVVASLGQSTGHGLHNQKRRAKAIGAIVNWISGPTGTQFMLWLPLQHLVGSSGFNAEED